jgi:C4-dicarboxylate-specific signal transduction histidine kinase
LVAFLGTAGLITRLMFRRKQAEEALQMANSELESKVQQRTAELARANDELRGEMRERQRAEEALQKAQVELAHITRVMTLGELMASIAHEVNQPLAAVVTNAQACLRWLALETPRLDEARAAVERIVRDSNRASEVIQRIRALVKKTEPQMVTLDINDVIREAISLEQREMLSQRVSLRTELASALPPVLGDRVQLQQVVINLVMNAVEAMAPVTDRPRDMLIRSQQDDANEVLGRCGTPAWGLTHRTRSACSTPSSPKSPPAWEWGCRSAVRSSWRMAADCGYRQMRTTARLFSLRCRVIGPGVS